MNLVGRLGVAFGLVGLAVSSRSTLLLAANNSQVGLLGQSDMLIWNPETKTEHLIQSSIFASNAKQFDFVVPTPSMPKVQMLNGKVFREMHAIVHPKREIVVDKDAPPSSRTAEKVEVVQEAQVGNLKATTIKAFDALALGNWLEKNGYKLRLAQNQWLEKYLKKRWYITAFKVMSDKNALQTEAVRLSFKTDVPVLPYFAPQNSWVRGVKLDLYVVSPVDLVGFVGGKKVWAGKQETSTFLSKEKSEKVAFSVLLSAKDMPKKAWVQRYLEIGNGSTAVDDLYFYPRPKVVPAKPAKVLPPRR